ncbi:hypothetical protein PMAYCL1PPCAC_20798, partial [Pristionchus mayeri]
SAETPLATVEDWTRKTFEFSNQSTDLLAPVFSRTFDSMSIILKDAEPFLIQRSLRSLDFELSNCFQFEDSEEPSIRYLMFGVIESLHLTLAHLTDETEDVFERAVSTIDEWKKKSADFSNGSVDLLATVISRAFEMMLAIVKNIDLCHILRALGSLDFERSQSLCFENINELSIRSLKYGIIESIYLTLLYMIQKKYQTNACEDIPSEENHIPIPLNSLQSSNLNSTDQHGLLFTVVPKEEPIDNPILYGDQPFGQDFTGDEWNSKQILNETMIVPRKKRSSCSGISKSKRVKMDKEDSMENGTERSEMACPECLIRPKTAYGYIRHLRDHHKTTLMAKGIYLLCACGFRYNTQNDQKKHDKSCSGKEFTRHKLNED